jgi:hypothetical protein
LIFGKRSTDAAFIGSSVDATPMPCGDRLAPRRSCRMNDYPEPETARRAKGSVKEAIGKLTGNTRAQLEGAAEKAEAEVRAAADCPAAAADTGSGSNRK